MIAQNGGMQKEHHTGNGTGEAVRKERKTNPEPKQEDKQNERIPEKQTV